MLCNDCNFCFSKRNLSFWVVAAHHVISVCVYVVRIAIETSEQISINWTFTVLIDDAVVLKVVWNITNDIFKIYFTLIELRVTRQKEGKYELLWKLLFVYSSNMKRTEKRLKLWSGRGEHNDVMRFFFYSQVFFFLISTPKNIISVVVMLLLV